MIPAQEPDNDPWHRGIYRPNAQRLSISLAPLVAQRSLLFRVKADLAGAGKGVQSYDELEDVEESPLLYSITPSASANVLSTIDKVMPSTKVGKPLVSTLSLASEISSASHYSQESWKPDTSKIIPNPNVDRRRHAMAFSPSVNWNHLEEAFQPQGLTGGLNRRTLTSLPAQTPWTPSSARLKLNITPAEYPKENSRPTEGVLGDSTVVGSVRVVDEAQPVVAIRRWVMGLDTGSTLVEKQGDGGRQHENRTLSTESANVEGGLREDILAGAKNIRKSVQQKLWKKKSLGKTNTEDKEDQLHGLSKRFTTFSKKIGRLSNQPFKKEKQTTGAVSKADVEQPKQPQDPKLRLSKLQLPELQISPIRAFDLSPIASPTHLHPRAEPVPKVETEIPPINTTISLNPKTPFQRRDTASNRPTSSRSTAVIPSTSPLPPHLSSAIPQTPHKPTSPRSVAVPDMPPVPLLLAHNERRRSVRAPHEAPPSTPYRKSATPAWGHRRSRSSPAVPQFDFRSYSHSRRDIPPLPQMPMVTPKAKKHKEIRATVPSLPAGATKRPPPRPPRSKRPPGHLRTQSQPYLAIEGDVDPAVQASLLHAPPTQAERWDEIIATTPLSARRPRGRSFSSSSRNTTICDLYTSGLRDAKP